jgi:Ser/Thr protein kinase RdoA (MazF antagonist)
MASFADRSEAEQIANLEALGRRAIRAWDIEDPVLTPIKYRENAVFAVRSRDGSRSVMRVHRAAYRSDEAILSEFAWTRALDTAGFSVPQPLPTKAGDLLTTAATADVPGARQCDLMTWVDGVPAGSLEAGVAQSEESVRATYRSVGELAARVQTHGESWTRPAAFTRPSWDIDSLVGENPAFGRFWELDGIDDDSLSKLLCARDVVRTRLAALGPAKVLIHGDLLPDNLLVDDGVVHLIDFDDCGLSWPGMELVTSIFPLQIHGGFDAGLAGYLEGYRSLRSFPETDLELLPELLLARGLSYLGWPAGRPEIESVRSTVPFFVAAMTEAAEGYLGERS